MKKMYAGVTAFALFLLPGVDSSAFTCNDRIVSTGDTEAEVILKCGEPAGKDTREEEIIEKVDADTKRKATVTIDEWTYDPGPNALVRTLKFVNGTLVDIREGGYGHSGEKSEGSLCEESKISIGDTKAEVKIRCGEPSWKEERKEEIVEDMDPGTKRKVSVSIEEWTYNLGPNRFMRILTFRNGRLVDITTGDYGK